VITNVVLEWFCKSKKMMMGSAIARPQTSVVLALFCNHQQLFLTCQLVFLFCDISFFIFVLFFFLLNGILKKNKNGGGDGMGGVMNEGDMETKVMG
jgi:hypothetical protein